MNIGLYQSASTLAALERWQDAVSQNITSSQTTGFRKRTVQFSSEVAGQWNINPHSKGGSDDVHNALFTHTTAGINFLNGETQPTRRELDIAIQGDGFFEIKMEDGRKVYTRSGEFAMRSDRTLVAGGAEVMSDNESPIVLLPGGGAVAITRDGTVTQNGATLGKLALKKFDFNDRLIPLAGGMFFAPAEAGISTVEEPELLQGYLEQSNVQALREMVDLVVISRAYEANQKIITTFDEQMEKSLQALG